MPPGGPPFSFTPGWGPALYWVVPAPSPGSHSLLLGTPLYSQVFLSLPRGSTVTQEFPTPFLWAPHPVQGVPPSIPLFPLSAPRVPSRFRGSPLPTGSSLCPGVSLLLSQGSHSLFPVVLHPARGMCSPSRSSLLPSRRSHSLFPGVPPSARGVPCCLRDLSTPFPVVLFAAPGIPLCPRDPVLLSGDNPLLSGAAPSPHLGVAEGSPRTRGAAAAARGGAAAGAGAHPRCRWRGGAAAPSAIKRAAAPVPQRGRGSP